LLNVWENVAPEAMFPESNTGAAGNILGAVMLFAVTVWAAVSLFVHVTVLFTPMIIVICFGAKPGAAPGPLPAPGGIDTTTVDWAFARGMAVVNPEMKTRARTLAETEALKRIVERL
jgi:hypothetical protein